MESKELDLKLLKKIIKMDQYALYDFLYKELSGTYKIIDADGDKKRYLFCEGESPVMLVAHLDTVFETNSNDEKKYAMAYATAYAMWSQQVEEPSQTDIVIYHDKDKQVMWSPDGLGADDRVGVFMILSMVRQGLRPHILFTTDEETGSSSSRAFNEVYEKSFHKYGIKYLMELDRSGHSDCVFYRCDNTSFESYIKEFGFITAQGSFTDISVLCPALKIAGVNLSVGYFNEHSLTEMIDLFTMSENYDIIYYMVKESKKIKKPYKYVSKFSRSNKYFKDKLEEEELKVECCAICTSNAVDYVYEDGYGKICIDCFLELYE